MTRWLIPALLIVPIIEVYIILKVGQAIGGWQTFGLLVVWSVLGAWIVGHESGRAFTALRQAFATGRMPTRELADAALVLVGGTLLLAPGFLTDAVGLFFLMPFTRPVTRRLLERLVAAKILGSVAWVPSGPGVRRWQGAAASASSGPASHWTASSTRDARGSGAGRRGSVEEVIEGEIVD